MDRSRLHALLDGPEAVWLGLPGREHPPLVTAVLELARVPERSTLEELPVRVAAVPVFSHVPLQSEGRWVWAPLSTPPPVRVHEDDVFEDLLSEHLPPGEPWRLHLLPGLPGRGPRLVVRIHHALGDGATLVAALLQLVGSSHTLSVVSPRRGESLLAPLAALRLLSWREPRPRRTPSPEKRARFLGPYPLEALRSAARSRGGTLNDLLLAVVGGALEPILGSGLHAAAPVSRRRSHLPGNRFGLVMVPLPSGGREERLRSASRASRSLQRSGQSFLLAKVVSLVGAVPGHLGAYLRGGAISLLSGRSSCVVSNVVGPPDGVMLAGVHVTSISFLVPQVGDIPVTVGLVSYAGQVTLGVVGDRDFDVESFAARLDLEVSAFLG